MKIQKRFDQSATIAVSVLLLVASPIKAEPQAASGVTIAITDNLSDNSIALVVRDPSSLHKEIVVLKRMNANEETLEAVLAVLETLRRGDGRPTHKTITRVTSLGSSFGSPSPELRARTRSFLARLAQQPRTQIGNLGLGRWLPLSDIP